MREDNILFMLSTRLKDLCNKYGIFILSSTQLNGDWAEEKTLDQNLLRGAKSIADKIDVGMLLMPVRAHDLQSLTTVLQTNVFDTPNVKLCFYKNRRSEYKNVILWCKADLGCCRIKPIFCTNYNYELLRVEDLNVIVTDEKAF